MINYTRNESIHNNILEDSHFTLQGNNPINWNSHNISSTNMVMGKKLYYLAWVNNSIIPQDAAGQVYIVDCSMLLGKVLK